MDRNKIRVSGNVSKAVIGIIGAMAVTGVIVQLVMTEREDSTGRLQIGTFKTARGEHRCFDLPDRSRACLNTDSMLRFTYSIRARNIELLSGESLLTVAPDKRRFAALSNRFLTVDLSTQFLLRKTGTGTLMTVTVGAVRVTSTPLDTAMLTAFEHGSAKPASKADREYHRLDQVEFDDVTGTLHERFALTEQGLTQRLAWQRGRIGVTGLSLDEAFSELGRYQRIDVVDIKDPALRKVRLGGEIDTSGLKDFLRSLEVLYRVHSNIETAADGKTTVTLSRRHTKGN